MSHRDSKLEALRGVFCRLRAQLGVSSSTQLNGAKPTVSLAQHFIEVVCELYLQRDVVRTKYCGPRLGLLGSSLLTKF